MVELAWIVFSVLIVAGIVYTWKFVEKNKKYELQHFDSNFDRIIWLRDNEFIGDDNQPIKCMYCANDNFKKMYVDNIVYEEAWGGNIPVAYDLFCPECHKLICHYAYGAYVYE